MKSRPQGGRTGKPALPGPLFHARLSGGRVLILHGTRRRPLFRPGWDLDRISVPIDFLGINYYFRNTVRDAPEEQGQSTLRRPRSPPHRAARGGEDRYGLACGAGGLTEILVRIKEDYADLPIYVTENGRAVHDYIDPEGDVEDEERVLPGRPLQGIPRGGGAGRRPARLHGLVFPG